MQIPAFAATDDTAVQTGAQVQTSVNSQVGEILSNAINEETSRVQSPDNYFIDSITVSGNTATVNYSALIDCQLVVGVYEKCTPDSKIYESMITLGTASVKKEEQTAIVVFQDTVMPQYFQLRAYLIRDDGALLSEEYVESGYTKEIMDLKASSTSDYTPDRVLNLDSNNETNFAVLKDNVKVLVPDSSANIIQTSENGTYQIQNLSEALEKGDVVAIRTDNEGGNQDAAVFRVNTVSKIGSITTITADKNFDAAEAFAFMKVEIDPDESVSKFEPAGGQQPKPQSKPEQSESGNKETSSNSAEFYITWDAEHDGSHTEFSAGVTLSGTISWDIGINYYLADEISSSLITYDITGEGKVTVDAEFALYIPLPIGNIIINVLDAFKLDVGIYVKLDLVASVDGTVSFTLSNTRDDSFCVTDFDAGVEFTGFLGFVAKFETKALCIERETEYGIGAKITLSPSYDQHQGCTHCVNGEISVIFYGNTEKENKIIDRKSGVYREIVLSKCDIYISDSCGFGFGSCPNKLGDSVSDNTGQSDADNNSIEKYLDFIDNGDGTYSVTLKANITERCDLLEIPAYYNGGKVTRIVRDDVILPSRRGIYRITIPDTVTTIDDYAFRGCTNLKSIEIPESVTTIGNSVFFGCENFIEVNFLCSGKSPDKTIKSGMFQGCNLRKVTLPYGLTTIPNWLFYNQSHLSEIVIPDSVTSIYDNAFHGCTSLSKIEIPDSVTHIGDSAFYRCTSLSKIEIPDSVTSIGYYAFKGCTSLSEIIMPEKIDDMGGGVFQNCTSLKRVVASFGVRTFSAGNVTVSTTNYIPDTAFCGCTALQSVTIPDCIQRIDNDAFNGCKSLTDITLPSTIRVICDNSFANCKNLTSITLSPDIEIDCTAFSSCDNLSYIYFEGTTDEWNSIKWYEDDLGKQIDYDPSFVNYAKVICRKDNKIISYEKGQPTPTISNYGTVQSGSTAKQPLQTTLTNLIPDTLYNFYCYTGSTFNANELLYITQGKTDENGNLSVTYYPVEKNGAAQNTVEDAKCFPSAILGDIDLDGKINIADVVLLQKWLLAMPDAVLLVWEAGDINGDKKLNAKDLTELKRALLEA